MYNLVVAPYASFIAEGLLVEDQDGEEAYRPPSYTINSLSRVEALFIEQGCPAPQAS